MKTVLVTGSFDNLRSFDLRLLEEASKLGELCVCLWSDQSILRLEGQLPKFSLKERLYFLNAIRYVSFVEVCPDEGIQVDSLRQREWSLA